MSRVVWCLLAWASVSLARAPATERYYARPDGIVIDPPAASVLPPGRVIAVPHGPKGAIVFVLSDPQGKLPEPLEILDRDSVLPAKAFGLPTAEGSFRLDRAGVWRKTTHRRYRVWLYVATSPPVVRPDWYETPVSDEELRAAAEQFTTATILVEESPQ